MNWPERSLFGGAITCRLPEGWYDLSDIRPVPDHQECFCYDDPSKDATSMWVMELFTRHDDVNDDTIAQYFFQDLARVNGGDDVSTFFHSDDIRAALDGLVLLSGSGVQHISPGNSAIAVELSVLRLPEHQTDVLVTLSTPLTDGVDHLQKARKELFQQILSTIQIRDYSLFGG